MHVGIPHRYYSIALDLYQDNYKVGLSELNFRPKT